MQQNIKGLYDLAKDRALSTYEIHLDNDYYGNATILKRYLNLSNDYQIKAAIEHGLYLRRNGRDFDINAPLPALFTLSSFRHPFLRKYTNKKLFSIGPMLNYVDHYLDSETLASEKKRLGHNLLAFPAKSTHWLDVNYDIHRYCKFLEELGKNFDNIRVCLYWKDILRGFAEKYMQHGVECITAGHMYDPEFLSRLKSIIATASFTTSNRIGTNLGFCVLMGKQHYLAESEVNITSKNREMLLECTDLEHNIDAKLIRNAFTDLRNDISFEQKEIVNQYWGFNEHKSVKELKLIIHEVEELYQKRNNFHVSENLTNKSEYLFEGTFDEILTNISKVIKTYPRREKGKLKINNREIIFTDLHSFYHQAIQIFKSDIYGFKTDKDNPVILDCGAHVGLASIYFATKYPNSSIHAFEADPAIAKMLTENINSFGS